MKILAIETSCDETAISILEFSNSRGSTSGKVLSHIVSSQVALHAPFGGVVPNIAKREHQLNLIPLLQQALTESNLLVTKHSNILENVGMLDSILEREPELLKQCLEFLPTIAAPEIDAIAVTHGPGLEPALWVGVNFAKALATAWQKPLIPVSHMEGHIYSSVLKKLEVGGSEFKIETIEYPAVALLISGGHTELVLTNEPLKYELLGQTRDDAVGEAFDKVARLLDLPYPGGPQISALAEKRRKNADLTQNNGESFRISSASVPQGSAITLPRPMIDSNDLDFSFSGLKTAVRYMVEKLPKPLSEETKIAIAHEFEESVTEVIVRKTRKALEQTNANNLLVGGGVIANKRIRLRLAEAASEGRVTLHLPEPWLTGDNATMIAAAAYFRSIGKSLSPYSRELEDIKAQGTLRLHS